MHKQLKIVGFPITSVCNLHCKHCLKNRLERYKNYVWNMRVEQAEIIATKISEHTKCVNVSAGYGETYLNPYVSSILSVFYNHNLKTISYTNATPITIERIVLSYTHLLMISFDGFHFKSNRESVERLLNIYSNEKKFASEIRLNVVLQPSVNEIELIDYLADLCFRHPSIIAEFHWLMPYDPITKMRMDYSNTLKSLLSSNNQFIPPSFTYSSRNKCNDIFESLYFDEDGNVRSCCIYMQSDPNNNIYRNDIPEIYNSNYLNDKRRSFISNNGFSQCSHCPIGHDNIW